MIIRSFSIDGFGIFANQTVPDLPNGVSIFLGDNEAGKSTCLKFFRHILFGFPAQTNKEFCPPLRGGNPGGSLLLDSRAQGQLRVERRPGVRGGPLTLQSLAGERLDTALLDSLLGGVTRDVYESVYGFSLSELQELRSLSGEKVRHALYGASFGTATKPVGQVLKRLEDAQNAVYKSSGHNPPLNKKLAELDEILRQIRDCSNTVTSYEQTVATRNALTEDLQHLLTEKNDTAALRNELVRKLSLWEQMQRVQTLQTQLDAITPAIDNFPVEGLARLDLMRKSLAERAADHATAFNKREQLQARQRALGMERHQILLAHQAPIAALVEEKGRYRALTDQCRDAAAESALLQSHIQRLFEELGAGWSAERVRSFDRSVFTRERIEQFALSMGEASAEADKAREHHETRQHELANAATDLRAAESDLQRLGTGLTAYDPDRIDQLAARKEHIQRLLEELPRKEQAFTTTTREVDSEIAALVPDWKREHIRTLDTSFTARGGIAALGRALSDTEQALHDAQVLHKAAEAQLHPLDERIQQRQAELHRFSSVVTKEMVEGRRNALRALRTTLRELAEAQQRLTMLQTANSATPSSHFILLAGAVLSAAAGAGLLAPSVGFLDLPEALLPWASSLPYGGYALLGASIVGIILLVLRKRGPQTGISGTSEAQHLLAEADVEELSEQAQAFAVQAGADTLDGPGLDRAEIALDLMREDEGARERILRSIVEMQQERERIARQVQEAGRTIDSARNERDLARQNWNVHAKDLRLPATTTPEMALSILDRVEGIRARLYALETAAQDMATMQRTIDTYMDLARTILNNGDIEQATQSLTQAELFDAVVGILDNVRRSRETDHERARAAQALHERKALHARCQEALRLSTERLNAATGTLQAVQAQWQAWLAERGLAETLSTATALTALQNVTDCVARLDTQEAQKTRITALQREIALFAERQDTLLAAIGEGYTITMPRTPDGTPDRMAAADMLSQALTAAREAVTLHSSLDRELSGVCESEQTLAIQKQQLEQERMDLLAHGGIHVDRTDDSALADAEEQFRQHGQAFAQRQAILQELIPLKASLTSLGKDDAGFIDNASDNPDTGIAQLTEADRSAQEARLTALEAQLKDLEAQENTLRQQISDSNATLKGLATADDVAELRAREAGVREDIHTLSRDWARHALARHLIVEAKKTFERERQPAVIQSASNFFTIITGGSYSGLLTSLDDDSIRALLPSGDSRVPEQLSRGTQEQLFLALRLGFILSHSAQREPLPVIMDDILVNFDPGRAAHTAAALADLSRHNQILFFTCHPQTANTLRAAVQDAAVFNVQNGVISASKSL